MTTVQDFLRVLRDRWRIVVAAVIVGTALGYVSFMLQPVKYTADLTIYVAADGGGNTSSEAFQGAQLSAARVTSYVDLVASTRVTKQVVARLGLQESPADLAGQITASSTLQSVLINVAVVDRSPQRAAQIANSVGAVFSGLVDDIERPIAPGGSQAVAARVVEPADVPVFPSSVGVKVTVALGTLVGLVIGIVIALIRNAMDNSIKSPDQLRAVSGAPNLGITAFDKTVENDPLTAYRGNSSPHAEAFRQLRTNLRFVDVGTPRKVIVVTSAMPGEGKTTTTVNLAITLALARRRVLVIDGDLRRPKLAKLLGLEPTIGLTSVLTGHMNVKQATQQWGDGVINVLASGPLPPNPSELLGSSEMEELLVGLRAIYDVVLIDTPPLLPVTDAASVAPTTDGVLLVCRYRQTKAAQLEAAVRALESASATLLGTVFTMVPTRGPRAYARYHSSYRSDTPAYALEQLGARSDGPLEPPRPSDLEATQVHRVVGADNGRPVMVDDRPPADRPPADRPHGARPKVDGLAADRPNGVRPNGVGPNGVGPNGVGPSGARPNGGRPGVDRPSGGRPGGGQPGAVRPNGDRPTGDQPNGVRPNGDRPAGDRPAGDRPAGDRPAGDRPAGTRSDIDQPTAVTPAVVRPGADRPGGDRPGGERPSGDRPATAAPAAARPGPDQPPEQRPTEDRPAGERRPSPTPRPTPLRDPPA